jgi:cell wall assembly regulator SMI1
MLTRTAAQVCPQGAAGVVPARPDRTARKRVDAAWQRIETWLAAHAPTSRRALRPPATAARIDQAQRRMSVAFPPDLVASLLRHDGSAARGPSLPPFYTPMPVDEIVSDWAVSCQVLGETEYGFDRWWDKGFVPFATAGDGGCLVVDQSPGGHGRVGEFYPEEGTSFDRWPGSLTELLEKTARSLETGRPYDGRYRPLVDAEGALDWEII